jgi:hypothetical protein
MEIWFFLVTLVIFFSCAKEDKKSFKVSDYKVILLYVALIILNDTESYRLFFISFTVVFGLVELVNYLNLKFTLGWSDILTLPVYFVCCFEIGRNVWYLTPIGCVLMVVPFAIGFIQKRKIPVYEYLFRIYFLLIVLAVCLSSEFALIK